MIKIRENILSIGGPLGASHGSRTSSCLWIVHPADAVFHSYKTMVVVGTLTAGDATHDGVHVFPDPDKTPRAGNYSAHAAMGREWAK